MSFSEIAAKRAKAQQGKTAEKAIAKYLDKVNAAVLAFDWQRGYDARSAGGKFQRVAGDFSFFSPAGHGIIEVKEHDHDFRLPYKNYKLSQVAGAHKRELAGGLVLVITFSTSLDMWRCMPIEFFRHRDETKGSWDLSTFDCYAKLETILNGRLVAHLNGYEA